MDMKANAFPSLFRLPIIFSISSLFIRSISNTHIYENLQILIRVTFFVDDAVPVLQFACDRTEQTGL